MLLDAAQALCVPFSYVLLWFHFGSFQLDQPILSHDHNIKCMLILVALSKNYADMSQQIKIVILANFQNWNVMHHNNAFIVSL